ncbi:MAG: hypothetical protein QGG72_14095, partial [Verrucomicrobiota bacterium]|nr:hypothetical protein [Verrucomicrobiota bacterium]
VNPFEYERFAFILRIDAPGNYPLGQAWQALFHRLAKRSSGAAQKEAGQYCPAPGVCSLFG